MSTVSQLALAVQLPDDQTFDSFQVGENQASVDFLQEFIALPINDNKPQSVYVFGASGVGKSHLMHACCVYAENLQQRVFYLSFKQMLGLSPEILEGLEFYELVCLDDVQCIAGLSAWQQAVFDLFNRVHEQGNKIILSANDSTKNLNITLPDLVSRLSWGYSEHIKLLNDNDKILALQYRAKKRGLFMHDDVAKYLITHQARDMNSLIDSLDNLDKASMREQRKLTIPFIKHVLFDV